MPRLLPLSFILLVSLLGSFVQAQLPLDPKPGTRIAFIGNSLFDRMRDDGSFEALLHQRFPQHHLIMRNLAWSADEVALRPRPDGFGDLNQHLTEHQADVIFAAFGFNESFKGEKGLPEFETLLKAFLIEPSPRSCARQGVGFGKALDRVSFRSRPQRPTSPGSNSAPLRANTPPHPAFPAALYSSHHAPRDERAMPKPPTHIHTHC